MADRAGVERVYLDLAIKIEADIEWTFSRLKWNSFETFSKKKMQNRQIIVAASWNYFSFVFISANLPCAVINLPIGRYFHSHILSGDEMIFSIFYIPEVRIWSPEKLCGIRCHIERFTIIILKPWIMPPLSHKNVHRVLLKDKERTLHFSIKTFWEQDFLIPINHAFVVSKKHKLFLDLYQEWLMSWLVTWGFSRF